MDDDQQYTYSPWQVRKLIGLAEGLRYTDGRRDLTVCDLLSWASDPGGDRIELHRARVGGESAEWMARRGPLLPGSEAATLLWDFLRAMRRLGSVRDQAIVALVAFGFSFGEIAEALGTSRSTIDRRLLGRYVRDRTGSVVRKFKGGPPARTPGLVDRLTDLMNDSDEPALVS